MGFFYNETLLVLIWDHEAPQSSLTHIPIWPHSRPISKAWKGDGPIGKPHRRLSPKQSREGIPDGADSHLSFCTKSIHIFFFKDVLNETESKQNPKPFLIYLSCRELLGNKACQPRACKCLRCCRLSHVEMEKQAHRADTGVKWAQESISWVHGALAGGGGDRWSFWEQCEKIFRGLGKGEDMLLEFEKNNFSAHLKNKQSLHSAYIRNRLNSEISSSTNQPCHPIQL